MAGNTGGAGVRLYVKAVATQVEVEEVEVAWRGNAPRQLYNMILQCQISICPLV